MSVTLKQAFLDSELTSNIRLTSANSINIARLIPQSFYYFEAYKQLKEPKNVIFSVPSGNFGNLTAGLFAAKLGLPVQHFIAATNKNDIVPHFLNTGKFIPKTSIQTISNAMDVGNPSNFARMEDLFSFTWNNFKEKIQGFSFTDQETEEGMREIKNKYDYIIDPHGAVAYNALKKYQSLYKNTQGIILETAHPSKFLPDVERVINTSPNIPKRLLDLKDKQKEAHLLKVNYLDFKNFLLNRY